MAMARNMFQLVRRFRYKDLYDNVLFNYQWLYNKMCALPLPEVLGDFEDAIKNIRRDPTKDDTVHKEISLVADSLRLGGAILKFYPGMLAAQLVGRLLPEIEHSDNIRNLLRQCDEEGIKQNALVPTYHCMHTPGGPLTTDTSSLSPTSSSHLMLSPQTWPGKSIPRLK